MWNTRAHGRCVGSISHCLVVRLLEIWAYTRVLGVMLGVTVDAAAIVAIVVMVGVGFLITSVRVFWKHTSFLLLATAVSSSSSFSSAILSASGRPSMATPIVL
jgi:hypothetical protein